MEEHVTIQILLEKLERLKSRFIDTFLAIGHLPVILLEHEIDSCGVCQVCFPGPIFLLPFDSKVSLFHQTTGLYQTICPTPLEI